MTKEGQQNGGMQRERGIVRIRSNIDNDECVEERAKDNTMKEEG